MYENILCTFKLFKKKKNLKVTNDPQAKEEETAQEYKVQEFYSSLTGKTRQSKSYKTSRQITGILRIQEVLKTFKE